MRTVVASLASVSPYQQSKPVREKKTRDETHEDFESRVWCQRSHIDKDGKVFIPPQAFKNCLSEAAKYKSIQIPGKGKSTYTKHFEAGVMCSTPVVIGNKSDIVCLPLFVPSDGRRGGTTRVWKKFPVMQSWEAEVEFLIFDELIDNEVFETHLSDAGQFIGIGAFRPRNNGYFGRFEIKKIKFS